MKSGMKGGDYVQYVSTVFNNEIKQQVYDQHEEDLQLLNELEKALENENLQAVKQLLNRDYSRILNSNLKVNLLSILIKSRSYFWLDENEELLGKYYLYKGHMYFMAGNREKAEQFYQKSMTFSLKYKHYIDYAFALNGYANIAASGTLELKTATRFAAILSNMHAPNLNNPSYLTYFYYVQTLIANHEYEQILALNARLAKNSEVNIVSFEGVQITLIRFIIARYLKNFDEAITLCEFMLNDPVFDAYTDLQLQVSESLLKLRLTVRPSVYLKQVKTYCDKKKLVNEMTDEFNEKVFSLQNIRKKQFDLPLPLFKERASRLFEFGLADYMVLMMEFETKTSSIVTIKNQFHSFVRDFEKHFKEQVIIGTKIECSKIIYLIKGALNIQKTEVSEYLDAGSTLNMQHEQFNYVIRYEMKAFSEMSDRSFDTLLAQIYADLYYKAGGV